MKLNSSPAKAPEPQQPTPTIQPEIQSPAQEPEQSFDDQIISEEDLFNQYDNDTKQAADVTIDEKTGDIKITPEIPDNVVKPPLSDLEAFQNTKMFMRLRERVQSTALAYFVDGNWREKEKYDYPDAEFNELVAAWQPLIQKTGLRLSPWWNVLVAEFTCTGPLVMVAMEAHKFRKERDELIIKNQRQEEKIKQYERQETFEKPKRSPDSQKKWAIDERGFFAYTAAGVHIKIALRTEKPNLKTDYEMLCKHNGKEYVDNVFKLKV